MNITIGKYIPGTSFVHRLDPRVKLFTNILFIILVFLAKSLLMEAILIMPLMFSFIVAGLKPKQLIKMIIPVIFIGAFLFIINIFVIKPDKQNVEIYASWWKLNISNIAIGNTLLIMVRIYTMIIATTILTATTRPSALTRAIENLLWPLKLLFVPVHIIAMIISIALRFIPTLLEESQRIMKAQASRGVDFKNGGPKTKAIAMVTLIIPLFVSAFAKADDLGNAMETRGYDPYEKRTKYRDYPPKPIDFIVSIIVLGLLSMVILNKIDIIILPQWIK